MPAFAGGALPARARSAAVARARPRARRARHAVSSHSWRSADPRAALVFVAGAVSGDRRLWRRARRPLRRAWSLKRASRRYSRARPRLRRRGGDDRRPKRSQRAREFSPRPAIGPRNSLPFLDVAGVREQAGEESARREAASQALSGPPRDRDRRAPALRAVADDGVVQVVAADGAVIDDLRDQRFADLPLVVGDGANEARPNICALLDAPRANSRPRSRAGVLVAGRRWNLQIANGLDIRLPETDPAAAVATPARAAATSRASSTRDILWLDLRPPGARLRAPFRRGGAGARQASREAEAKGGAP